MPRVSMANTPVGGGGGFLAALQKQLHTAGHVVAAGTGDDTGKASLSFNKSGDRGIEGALQAALRRRMPLDFMSERSGAGANMMEQRKFTPEVICDKLDKYKTKGKKTVMNRESLIEFVAQEYSVSMTMLSATDAILFCRGPQLDQSENYNEEKLVHWLQSTLPGMRKLDNRFQPRREAAKSLNTSQDNFHLFKLSGVGTLNLKKQHQKTFSVDLQNSNQAVLNQMNDCLKECDKVPSLKRKVQETLTSLEQSMLDHRA